MAGLNEDLDYSMTLTFMMMLDGITETVIYDCAITCI